MGTHRALIHALLLSIFCCPVLATVHTVCSSGCDYTTITAAISAASAGDTLFIQDATHTEAGITISKNLTVLGSGANNTTIQAHASGQSASDRLFTVNSGVDAKLEELTLARGYITSNHGACISNAGTLTLEKCYILDNWITGSGDYHGGGIYNTGTLTVSRSTFAENRTAWLNGDGGAIYNSGTATLINSTFNRNAGMEGSGLYNAGTATIINCTFYRNIRWSYAGGVYNANSATIYLKNNLMAHSTNTAGDQIIGGDYNNWGGSETTQYNVILSSDGWTTGTGDKHAETATPIYVSSGLALNNSVFGTMTMKTSSGSININNGDTATFNGVAIPVTDQRGASRNGTIDIGAYEYYDDEGSLPVELSSFTAEYDPLGFVRLRWVTESEIENLGFIIDRSSQGGEWIEIAHFQTHAELEGQGSTNSQTSYQWIDDSVEPGIAYSYRLSDMSYLGVLKTNSESIVDIYTGLSVPQSFALHQNHPNPFNPSTSISYDLPQLADVNLIIYDISGREIKTLIQTTQSAGTYSVQWDGSDDSGEKLSTGVYLCRIGAGGFSKTIKMVYLK